MTDIDNEAKFLDGIGVGLVDSQDAEVLMTLEHDEQMLVAKAMTIISKVGDLKTMPQFTQADLETLFMAKLLHNRHMVYKKSPLFSDEEIALMHEIPIGLTGRRIAELIDRGSKGKVQAVSWIGTTGESSQLN